MRRAYWWEIGSVLAFKLVLLCGLYYAFFDLDHRVAADPEAVTAHLLGGRGK